MGTKPLGHIAISGLIGAFVWWYFKSIGCAVVSFLVGIGVDFDHFMDYYLSRSFTYKVKDIYIACLKTDLKKLYLALHSYEIVVILWGLIFVLSLSNLWKAAAIGLTQHIIVDQFTNPIRTFGYFIIFRAIKRFDSNLIVSKTGE